MSASMSYKRSEHIFGDNLVGSESLGHSSLRESHDLPQTGEVFISREERLHEWALENPVEPWKNTHQSEHFQRFVSELDVSMAIEIFR